MNIGVYFNTRERYLEKFNDFDFIDSKEIKNKHYTSYITFIVGTENGDVYYAWLTSEGTITYPCRKDKIYIEKGVDQDLLNQIIFPMLTDGAEIEYF
jgi:hypothetical protein